jgi:hypothetical protein
MADDLPSLREKAPFWCELGGPLAGFGVGLVAIGVGRLPMHGNPWASDWVIAGVILIVLGYFALSWSLVLVVAHHHAKSHWCPDREAHNLAPNDKRGQLPLPIEPPDDSSVQLRSILRQLKSDVQRNKQVVEQAIQRSRYWGIAEGPSLSEDTWKRNRAKLEGIAGLSAVLDSLDVAFIQTARVSQIRSFRVLKSGKPVHPEDDLPSALKALTDAESVLLEHLRAMGS